jgi:hypothetical protein
MNPHAKNSVVTAMNAARRPPFEFEESRSTDYPPETFINAARVGSSLCVNGRMAAPTAGASSDSIARSTGAIAGMVDL